MNSPQPLLRFSHPRFSHPALRFSLRTVLLVMLLLACMLAAFMAGNRAGFDRGFVAGKWSVESKMRWSEVYSIEDLVRTANLQQTVQDADSLMDLIARSVTSTEWEQNGGNSAIEFFPTNQSLVITHTGEGHAAVKEFLNELRRR